MRPGAVVIADNIFTIQNNYSTDPAYKAIQVFTGEFPQQQKIVGGAEAPVAHQLDRFLAATFLQAQVLDQHDTVAVAFAHVDIHTLKDQVSGQTDPIRVEAPRVSICTDTFVAWVHSIQSRLGRES